MVIERDSSKYVNDCVCAFDPLSVPSNDLVYGPLNGLACDPCGLENGSAFDASSYVPVIWNKYVFSSHCDGHKMATFFCEAVKEFCVCEAAKESYDVDLASDDVDSVNGDESMLHLDQPVNKHGPMHHLHELH